MAETCRNASLQVFPVSPLAQRRSGGVCMHITSLPGPGQVGTLGNPAHNFIECIAKMGLTVWQFLPIGPTGYGDSPYQSLSTFAGNELLLDLDGLIAMGLLECDELEAPLERDARSVDYAALNEQKLPLLTLAAGRFQQVAGPQLHAQLQQFIDKNNALWLHDYALFRVLKNRHQQAAWTTWDPAFATRQADALAQVERECADDISAVKTLQFLFNHQWQAMRAVADANGVTLFGDLPIYIASDSADAWAHPEILQVNDLGRPQQVAGVPPDYFSEDGQLWGNPLYDWEHHDQTGYQWWVNRLAHAIGLMDLVRIDHFRGFEAYWAVPAQAPTAREGQWMAGPGNALFDALASALANSHGALPIIAEDLGVITPAVDALREGQNLPGMKVLQFMVGDPDFDAADIVQNCVCYTGTHDNDTSVGWFHGGPGDVRSPNEVTVAQNLALANISGNAESVARDLIGFAFRTQARLAIAPMQDFLGLGSPARMNTPGSTENNWRWRMSNEELTPALIGWVADQVRLTGRQPDGKSDSKPDSKSGHQTNQSFDQRDTQL